MKSHERANRRLVTRLGVGIAVFAFVVMVGLTVRQGERLGTPAAETAGQIGLMLAALVVGMVAWALALWPRFSRLLRWVRGETVNAELHPATASENIYAAHPSLSLFKMLVLAIDDEGVSVWSEVDRGAVVAVRWRDISGATVNEIDTGRYTALGIRLSLTNGSEIGVIVSKLIGPFPLTSASSRTISVQQRIQERIRAANAGSR